MIISRFLQVFLIQGCVLLTVQQVYNCPEPWIQFEGSCYNFVFYPTKLYPEAKVMCMDDGAALVSINTQNEHNFVSQWLISNDPAINTWYTSGVIDEETKRMTWEGDGSSINEGQQFWLNAEHQNKAGDHIVYTYGVFSYLWSREYALLSLPYICEISQSEAYKIIKEDRDFDFGSNYSDPVLAPRGPKFILHQQSVVVVRTYSTLSATIEYVATGLPQPSYTIIQRDEMGNVTEITPTLDSRYTVTDGKLTIARPTESEDAGQYYCIARNQFGTVVSNPMFLSFGFLAEFSNVDPSPVYADNHDRAAIDCYAPNHRPAVTYQWYKGDYHFIRPDLQQYMFISRNGRLYFSVVSDNDAGNYRCIVKLASNNGASIGTNQAPSRISRPIPLIIQNTAASIWGPEIANDFIYVSPTIPKRGQNVYLECLAYGTLPLTYHWTREGLPMPPAAKFEDHNRLLVIPNVNVEDGGSYTCHVTRQNIQSVSKSHVLVIEAEPFFLFPLKDQHIDQGSQLTWHCAARGIPKPTYFWLRDGVRLQTIPGDITVSSNVLVIHNADPIRHNGMYQCGAENKHGTSHTEGQLRVLGFAPTFVKRPVEELVYGGIAGNASFTCHPDAAPFPVFKWLKDGLDLSLVLGDTSSRIRMLANGNLLITEVNSNDAGYFTCEAENTFGVARSAGQLVITSRTVINVPPLPATVYINETAFLRCAAAINPGIDYVYLWTFNGQRIDPNKDMHFVLGTSQSTSGLFIRMAQHKHAGYYECFVKTPMDTDSARTTLTVQGPPGEIAYVYAASGTITATSARLGWTLGQRHGAPILYYTIESSSEPYTNWTTLIQNLPEADVIVSIEDSDRRLYLLGGLKPGIAYKFRVRAANLHGIGPFSRPSDNMKINANGRFNTVMIVLSEKMYFMIKPYAYPKTNTVYWTDSKVTSVKHYCPIIKYAYRACAKHSLPCMIYQTLHAPPATAPYNVGGGGGSVADLTITWDPLPPEDHGGSGIGYYVYWRRQGGDRWAVRSVKGNVGVFITLVGVDYYYLQYDVMVQPFNDLGYGPNSTIVTIYSAEALPIVTVTGVSSIVYNATAIMINWAPVDNTREVMKGKIMGYQVNYWERYDPNPIVNAISWRVLDTHGLIIGLLPNTWYSYDVQVFNTAGLNSLGDTYFRKTMLNAPLHYPTEVAVHSHGSESVSVSWRGVMISSLEESLNGYKIRFWLQGDDITRAMEVTTGLETHAILYDINKGELYQLRICATSRGGDGNLGNTVYFTLGGQVVIDPTISEIRAGAPSVWSKFVIFNLTFCFLISLFIYV